MKKINWFARLFMSWNSLVDHVSRNDKLKEDFAVLQKEMEMQIKLTNESKLNVENLNNLLNENKTEKEFLSKEIQKITSRLESKTTENTDHSKKIAIQEETIENLKDRIRESKSNLQSIKKEINEKLIPLNKIEKTFFAAAGNKGKGELGEMQLKTLLQKSGLDENIWLENLQVGSSTVEFAIKSGNDDNKWIPIDSKVLDTEVDEDNKIIVNSTFRQRVLTQVKSITKYLGKSNTADYGLLVLQNDAIYMELYKEFPTFFKEVIEDHKIYITSPLSFVQITWSITHIIKIYERVHKDQMIYDEMISILDSVTRFSISLTKTHSDFNIAMNKHYPTIQNKQEKLVKKLSKEGKIKTLPTIEAK